MRPTSPLLLALALAAACTRPAEPAATVTSTPTSTPTATATPTATPTAPPIPQPPPSALKLARELVALEAGGALALSPDAETVIDPASTFRVVLGARFEEARLQLLDGADAAVPARGTREVGETTVLTLAPAGPLVPASRYHLRLDGDRTRELQDASGGVHAPFTVTVLVAGSPPPPEPVPKKKRKGR